jgi:ribosome-associated protein
MALPATPDTSEVDLQAALARAVTVRYSRSSGPGGQHANSSSTRVVASVVIADLDLQADQLQLLHDRFGLSTRAVAQDSRSQADNRARALARLEDKLRATLAVMPERIPTTPSPAALRRVQEHKQARSNKKRDRAWRPE